MRNVKVPDYVIVGSGPAGCVLAARLSEDAGTEVLLLEAGGSDRKLTIAMAAAIPLVYQDKSLNWGEQSGPEPDLAGLTIDAAAAGRGDSKGAIISSRQCSPTFRSIARPGAKKSSGRPFASDLSRRKMRAVALANDSRFGLAAAVMSKDDTTAERVPAALRAGIFWINCSQPTFTETPWGGYKQSGIGRELGRWGFENYLETKQVTKYVSDDPWGWYIKRGAEA